MISWHSIGNKRLPLAFLNTLTVKSNRSSNGCGPLARPPITFNFAPASRTSDTSHVGTCPAYNKAINSRKAFAHPGLLSATRITVLELSKLSETTGSLSTFSLSTLKPTPVPHIRMYMHSSNARGLSTGM